MPSGSKKRRAAANKKKKELEEKLSLKSIEKSQDVISISTCNNAYQEDGSLGGNVATVIMSKQEDKPENEPFSVEDNRIQANADFDPEESKENQKISELLAKDDSMHLWKCFNADSKPKTETESTEDASDHVHVKLTEQTAEESAKESEVFVLQSGNESSKKIIDDAAKMTQNDVASDPKGTDKNAFASNVATEQTVDEKAKEIEVFVLQSGNESSEESISNDAKMTQDDVASDPNGTDKNAFASNDETGLKYSSVDILDEDGSGFTPKQGDDISLSGDKENTVDILIQNDEGSMNSNRAASPSFNQEMLDDPKGDDQHEALQATKSTISNEELHQKSTLLPSSGCILCELLGGNIHSDGKILARGQINRLKKMLEEELLATEKLGATLKKLIDDLEDIQNNNDIGLPA